LFRTEVDLAGILSLFLEMRLILITSTYSTID
jgi:hypothetical protein